MDGSGLFPVVFRGIDRAAAGVVSCPWERVRDARAFFCTFPLPVVPMPVRDTGSCCARVPSLRGGCHGRVGKVLNQ